MPIRSILLLGLLAISLPVQAQIEALYSSVESKDCATESSSERLPESERSVDFYTGECAGFGGYRVFITGSDARYALQLRYAGHVFDLRSHDVVHLVSSPRIEWRFQVAENQNEDSLRYRALIFRMDYESDTVQGDSPLVSELVVVRLQGSATCVIGLVPQSDAMVRKARQLADNLSLPCLKP